MVNFTKKLTKDQIPGWEEYYFNYKLLKARVKVYTEQTKEGNHDRRRVLKDFSKLLDDEIEKIVLFMIEQQGLIAARLEELGKRRTVLEDIPLVQEIAELKEDYRAVGLDLVRLLKFVDLNANAVRKILKKFDERLGYKFTDYYVRSRSNHPFSQLKQVFKHVGIGAVVGALSRNLGDLEEREGSYLNIYDQSPLAIPKDPIIDMIKATADKLTNSTNFLQFLGQHALIAEPDDAVGTEEEHTAAAAEAEEKYHFISLVLNLANTFLYMVNTYIVVPTADDYATSLGAAATVCGIIIGTMPVAQVFSSVYFSAWSNRSYFRPLLFSSVVLLLGNVMYAMAYDFDSLAVLLVGRALCGVGSARAVNRRYISDCVPPRIRMQASAAFVSASALGMACGPAIAGLLQVNFKLYGFTINQETLPGWVMAFGWLAYLIWLWMTFEEPVLGGDTDEAVHRQGSSSGSSSTRYLKQGLAGEHLLKQDAHGDSDDQEEETPSTARAPSVVEAYRLLTPSVKVQLLIYFMLKFSMEILLSESSVVTSYYFGWTTSTVAIFLATLGLTVLPINAVVGTYISNMFEDRQILVASEMVLLAGVLLSFNVGGASSYTAAQYVCSALLTFVAAEVLEGVNLSLLSQVMPAWLSRGTWNGGLLSTEAGTLARVAADGTITLAGYLGQGMLLNVTLLPSLLICVASIAATFSTYNFFFFTKPSTDAAYERTHTLPL